MVWKIFKWLGIALAGLLLLVIALPFVPVAKDAATAGPYRAWLEETAVPLTRDADDLGFAFDDGFYENRFFMLSEMHGYAAVQTIDLALLRHLHDRAGVRTYLAEMDPAQALAVNDYLAGGDDAVVREMFDLWADSSAQWANREYFAKLTAIRAWNGTLPPEERVWFVGIDAIHDRPFAERQLGVERNQPGPGLYNLSGVQMLNVDLLVATLDRDAEGEGRYDQILSNVARVAALTDADDRFYGLWGLFHGSKTLTNGNAPLARRMNAEDGAFPGAVGTIATMCIEDCFNMMPARAVPGPFKGKDGEDYTLLPMTFGDTYLSRVRGAGELRSAMGEGSLLLVDVAGEGSPYDRGQRLLGMSGYVGMATALSYEGSAADAFDYLVVMRNSPALTPWRGRAYDPTGGEAAKVSMD